MTFNAKKLKGYFKLKCTNRNVFYFIHHSQNQRHFFKRTFYAKFLCNTFLRIYLINNGENSKFFNQNYEMKRNVNSTQMPLKCKDH